MNLYHQHLVKDCQTQKVPDNFSLEQWSNTRNVSAYSQENMYRYIKSMDPRNTIDIDGNVGMIALGPQYNNQGGYFIDIPLIEKFLQWSHWKPYNMTEGVIEQYDNFNTKRCPEDLVFGDFDNQTIPSTYSDFINYYYDYGTTIDANLPDKK